MTKSTLIHGECLEMMRGEVKENSVDLILCDLPYGATACKWDIVIDVNQLWKEWHRVLKPDGQVILFGTEPFMSTLIQSNRKEYHHQLYWLKPTFTNYLNAKKEPLRCIEEIAVFRMDRSHFTYNITGLKKLKKPKKNNGKKKNVYGSVGEYTHTMTGYPKQVLSYCPPANNKRYHPTEKPVDLLEYLIKTYSNPGDVVLDSTMGSGSTGVASVRTGRRFIGIELNEQYYKTALYRINKEEMTDIDHT